MHSHGEEKNRERGQRREQRRRTTSTRPARRQRRTTTPPATDGSLAYMAAARRNYRLHLPQTGHRGQGHHWKGTKDDTVAHAGKEDSTNGAICHRGELGECSELVTPCVCLCESNRRLKFVLMYYYKGLVR